MPIKPACFASLRGLDSGHLSKAGLEREELPRGKKPISCQPMR
jgi:hypothetical protein